MTVTEPPQPFYADDAVTIWNADALALPIPDESVDLVVTSPPYFGLRSYTDGGEHYDGQIGSEPTPREFVDALIAATVEMVRVLKPSGSIWVNLGDKYARTGGVDRKARGSRHGDPGGRAATRLPMRGVDGVPDKSLIGIPWRYAIRCIDDLGLILRAEVIWDKANPMPESVTDRARRSHEHWFHFTREPRYFSAVDEIREEHLQGGKGATWEERKSAGQPMRHGDTGGGASKGAPGAKAGHPLGKAPGSVWTIATQPLNVPGHLGVDHFAAFPLEFPRRIIRGWSPAGICVECGDGRRPVAERSIGPDAQGRAGRPHGGDSHKMAHATERKMFDGLALRTISSYACTCEMPSAPTRPAVVLDPFGGTGTTALVAKALGRIGWHVDLSADYCRLAQWRVTDPGEMARAMQVEKPPAVPEDMDSLLDLLGEIA